MKPFELVLDNTTIYPFSDTQVPKDDVEAGSIDGAQTLPLGTEDPADISSEPTKCFPESCYRALPIIVCCDEQSQVKNSRGKSKIVLENKVYQNIVLVVIVVATLLLVRLVDFSENLHSVI